MATPRAARGRPTRRAVLLTAVTTAVGVATARVVGVRDLGTGFARRVAAGKLFDPGFSADVDPSDDASASASPQTLTRSSPEPGRPSAAPVSKGSVSSASSASPAASSSPVVSEVAPPILATGLDWVSPLDSDSARVAHLLRRATFGYTAAELEAARSDGSSRTIDRLIETPAAEPPPLPSAEAPDGRVPIGNVQRWWVDWMLQTPTPFAEAMTLFWHGHFTSDFRKGQPAPVYRQNRTWRRFALGKLPDMLYQVTVDPAMLRYLDLATSTGRNPNENYARELMELFTMGADAYTEDDVRAAAKGLAGWRLPRNAEDPYRGVYAKDRAYMGTLTFLGKTGTFDTNAVLGQILAQDATAEFITTKVVRAFVSPLAPRSYIARLANVFRGSGYDVKTLMRAVFTSPEFSSQQAYRALVKGPTEFAVSTAKALGSTSLVNAIVGSGTMLGQNLFDPPSVGGWPENDSWISSNTVLGRANFVTAALDATRALPPSTNAAQLYLDGIVSAQTAAELGAATDDRRRWFAVLASPESQLK